MRQTDGARAEILRSIRDNLAASVRHEHAVHAAPPASHHRALPLAPIAPAVHGADEPSSPLARFRERLEAVGGHCIVVKDMRAAAAAISAILIESGARRAAAPEAAFVEVLSREATGIEWTAIETMSREQLFQCEAGVTTAQWGIAETGTLVLESAAEKHRLLSLVPPVHVALLRADRICDSIGDALARLDVSAVGSGCVTFITGPSRTSDIELTLTIGVHGPGALHVVLLESTE